jgi:hypothetical protein
MSGLLKTINVFPYDDGGDLYVCNTVTTFIFHSFATRAHKLEEPSKFFLLRCISLSWHLLQLAIASWTRSAPRLRTSQFQSPGRMVQERRWPGQDVVFKDLTARPSLLKR